MLNKIVTKLRKSLKLVYYILFKSNNTFRFNGKELKYFYHWYNFPPESERTVEIPIVLSELQNKELEILEIGNVMNHYFPFKHDVIDKYEKAKGVINEDIVDYAPSKKYDLIFSISTLEHVGFDEPIKDPTKTMGAVSNIISLLKSGGRAIIVVPLGYNENIDKLVFSKDKVFNSEFYLKRISSDNKWIQIDKPAANSIRYGDPYPKANGLLVGIINK